MKQVTPFLFQQLESTLALEQNNLLDIFVKYPDESTETLSKSNRNRSSIYEAEINAITSAVEILHHLFELTEKGPQDIVTFSNLS